MFSHDSDEYCAHEKVKDPAHTAHLSHELIAAAAAYEAASAYERHVKDTGKRPSHEKAVELLAGFAGAFIDKIAETKGLDALDRERAKHDARKHAESVLPQPGRY